MAESGVEDSGGEADLGKMSKELKRFENLTILVGYQNVGSTDLAVIDIATFQEFGTLNIPARPFLSSAMDNGHDEIGDGFEKAIDAILGGSTAIKEAERLGILGVTLVKKRIIDSPSWAESLADVTIEAKGSSKPLVDIGEMLNSVTYTVNENDKVIASG